MRLHTSNMSELRHRIDNQDVKSIRGILESSRFFYDYEIEVAVGIAEEYLNTPDHNGYHFIGLYEDGILIGFTTYGLIPCTKDSYDLYWIAVHEDFRSKGYGMKLLEATENHILTLDGKRVYIETSSTEKYVPTQVFYLKAGYVLEACLKNYYREGDDKLMYSKEL